MVNPLAIATALARLAVFPYCLQAALYRKPVHPSWLRQPGIYGIPAFIALQTNRLPENVSAIFR